jgi:hypothetical protein
MKYYQLNPKMLRNHLGALEFYSCHESWYRAIVIGKAKHNMWSVYETHEIPLDISDCFAITRHEFHLQLQRHILINNPMTLSNLHSIYIDLGESFTCPDWEQQVKFNRLQIYKDKLSNIIKNLEIEGNATTEPLEVLRIKDDLEKANLLLQVAHKEFKNLTI